MPGVRGRDLLQWIGFRPPSSHVNSCSYGVRASSWTIDQSISVDRGQWPQRHDGEPDLSRLSRRNVNCGRQAILYGGRLGLLLHFRCFPLSLLRCRFHRVTSAANCLLYWIVISFLVRLLPSHQARHDLAYHGDLSIYLLMCTFITDMAEVKSFDKNKLKKSYTAEKNPLLTKEGSELIVTVIFRIRLLRSRQYDQLSL